MRRSLDAQCARNLAHRKLVLLRISKIFFRNLIIMRCGYHYCSANTTSTHAGNRRREGCKWPSFLSLKMVARSKLFLRDQHMIDSMTYNLCNLLLFHLTLLIRVLAEVFIPRFKPQSIPSTFYFFLPKRLSRRSAPGIDIFSAFWNNFPNAKWIASQVAGKSIIIPISGKKEYWINLAMTNEMKNSSQSAPYHDFDLFSIIFLFKE